MRSSSFGTDRRTKLSPTTSSMAALCISCHTPVRQLVPVTILGGILMLTGCCVNFTTAVRNQTGKDVVITVCSARGGTEREAIQAGAKAYLRGAMPRYPDGACDSWMVSDGDSKFIFSDISPIATMPSAFISRSRFTRDFPCKRVTQHVRLGPDMAIHAVRVIGYTASEPAPLPIEYTRTEDEN